MNGLLCNGVTAVTMPRFDMVEALKAVQDLKITRFFAVPPMVLGLANAPIVDDYDTSSIRQVFRVPHRSAPSWQPRQPRASAARLCRATA